VAMYTPCLLCTGGASCRMLRWLVARRPMTWPAGYAQARGRAGAPSLCDGDKIPPQADVLPAKPAKGTVRAGARRRQAGRSWD